MAPAYLGATPVTLAGIDRAYLGGSLRWRKALAGFDLAAVPWDLWLDGSTLTGADGNPVSAWTGRAGSATQATATRQPALRTTPPLPPDGTPVVDLDGTGDYLSTATTASSALTVFVVFRADVWPVWGGALAGTSGAGGLVLHTRDGGGGLKADLDGVAAVGEWIKPDGNLPTDQWGVYGLRYANPGAWELSWNGVTRASGTSTATTSAGRTRRLGADASVNANRLCDGRYAAVLQRNAALSAADFAAVGQALTKQYTEGAA